MHKLLIKLYAQINVYKYSNYFIVPTLTETTIWEVYFKYTLSILNTNKSML